MTLAGACLSVIVAAGLVLAGYIPGWFRGRAVGRWEQELSTDDFWGPEAEDDLAWESVTTAMPVLPEDNPTIVMEVPTITDVPQQSRRMSDREWLDRQASLGDLVDRETVRGRVVSAVPPDTMVCPVVVTAPQPALSDATQEFVLEMRRRTDEIISRLKDPVALP